MLDMTVREIADPRAVRPGDQAACTLIVTNRIPQNVVAIYTLPAGPSFVSADSSGIFDSASGAGGTVTWALPDLGYLANTPWVSLCTMEGLWPLKSHPQSGHRYRRWPTGTHGENVLKTSTARRWRSIRAGRVRSGIARQRTTRQRYSNLSSTTLQRPANCSASWAAVPLTTEIRTVERFEQR